MITRMAPTPSGYLHQGNLFNFMLSWLWARANGGKVLLRIDDADTLRKRPEYVEDIFRVLEKAGLSWDIGPAGPDDFEKQWSQKTRESIYEEWISRLAHKQLLYACTCSRTTLECRCREAAIHLGKKEVSWKISTESVNRVTIPDKISGPIPMEISDFVIRKKDGLPSYQLCSFADDAFFKVTHVVRGEDLLPSTAYQQYLNQQLNCPWPENILFWHHPLLRSVTGKKISKTAENHASSVLGAMTKKEMFTAFADWMQWDKIQYPGPEEMIAHPCLRM